MMTRIAGLVLGFMLAGPASAAPPARLYTIARVGSAIDDAEIVGAKRAGMMCLPNGAIRWGDIAAGTQMDQREIVQDAFEDDGLAVTPLGIAADHALRVRGTIRAATFGLCARRWLMGGSKLLSGDATLAIEWRVEDQAGSPAVSHVSTVSRRIEAGHAAPLGAIYRLMLIDAAKDAIGWLKAN